MPILPAPLLLCCLGRHHVLFPSVAGVLSALCVRQHVPNMCEVAYDALDMIHWLPCSAALDDGDAMRHMRHMRHMRQKRQTVIRAMHAIPALGRSLRWVSLGLLLLATACSTAPVATSVTPTTPGPRPAAITAYHGHTSTVFAVAWSPDGTRIASASQDGTIQV